MDVSIIDSMQQRKFHTPFTWALMGSGNVHQNHLRPESLTVKSIFTY